MGQAPVYNWSNSVIGRRGDMICSWKEVEDLDEIGKRHYGEILVFAFNFDLVATLLNYPRYSDNTE